MFYPLLFAKFMFLFFAFSFFIKGTFSSTAGSIIALTNLSSAGIKESERPASWEEMLPSTSSSTTNEGEKIIRLKELMEEVRALANEIKQERRRKRKEKIAGEKGESSSSSSSIRSVNRQMRKLRRKMNTKMQRIGERMRAMEEKMREQGKDLRKLAIQNGKNNKTNVGGGQSQTKKGRKIEFGGSTNTMAQQGEVRKVQIKRRGDEGISCKSHNDCLPGNCCQRHNSGLMETTCTFFGRKEGEMCAHSCACEAKLQCFKAKGTTAAETKAKCKRASSMDLLNGFYENSNLIFDSSFQ